MNGLSPEPIFKWETLKEVGPHSLPYRQPIPGKVFEVELTSGLRVRVFRADEEPFYFCHGLTFGGKEAPGGPVSPFSGRDVQTILDNHYRLVDPESGAIAGDILVWQGPGGVTSHSAILIEAVVSPGMNDLDDTSKLRSKNGRLPEADMSLEQLVAGQEGYGESYKVFRRK
jgi:hypothetical protein